MVSLISENTRKSKAETLSGLQPQFIFPYYSHSRTCLHRYLDSQFIERFHQEINQDLNPDEQQAWMSEDIMGPYNDLVTLRQPVHRTFYMISCALSCQRPGQAALAPEKITSAGFVIRKKKTQSYSIWSIENGNASGWYKNNSNDESPVEPDIYRRLKQQNIVRDQFPEPLFSGEEIHPMHIKQIRSGDGKLQTIAYGYLPIGGSYTPSPDNSSTNISSLGETLKDELIDNDSKTQLKKLLPWNFSLSSIDLLPNGKSKAATTATLNDENIRSKWNPDDGVLVINGESTWRFAKILRQAINHYHIGEHTIKQNDIANTDLFNKFTQLFFYRPAKSYREKGIRQSTLSLAAYLENIFANPDSAIHGWLQKIEKTIDSETINDNDRVGQLPELQDDVGNEPLSLKISQTDAQDINYLLNQRLQKQLLNLSMDIPLPKFTQGETDIYFIQPFIRTIENCQENIHWGEPSSLFRVAAPFDPEASRPAMIQMPSMEDVKRGIASGVNFLTPASMAKKLKSLKPGEGLTEDIQGSDKKPELDMGMICSFSLPIVTLCAMILLMIVISVLNFIFYWIPWVFTCLPYPKVKT